MSTLLQTSEPTEASHRSRRPTREANVHHLTTTRARHKGLVVAIGVLLFGLTGVALAESSHFEPAATAIDFRHTAILAWSLQLDADSPDVLHDVNCTHVRADLYQCVGKDASNTTWTLRIRVSNSGAAWQTIDDDTDR